MDGFIGLFAGLIRNAGAPEAAIFRKTKIELPGFFRPTKEWDMLVVVNGHLLAAIEAKSQVGPSFGNNFNNRTEEAIGSAVDLWTAYREGDWSVWSATFACPGEGMAGMSSCPCTPTSASRAENLASTTSTRSSGTRLPMRTTK